MKVMVPNRFRSLSHPSTEPGTMADQMPVVPGPPCGGPVDVVYRLMQRVRGCNFSATMPFAEIWYSFLVFASQTMTNISAPRPVLFGSWRAIMAIVATAASTAFPPSCRIFSPACAACGSLVATTPLRARISDRVWLI